MGTFLQELKRRKVLRVAAAYVVASWVLLQVAELLSSILELPIWSAKLALVILVIGFVPALILSWAYDLTPDGVEATANIGGSPADRRFGPIILAGALTIAGLIVGGWWYSGNDVRWAKTEAIPEIEALLDSRNVESAYSLALQVEVAIPNDPDMAEIWKSFSWATSIPSIPPGATVFRRAYDDVNAKWQNLGVTPLYDIHIPFGPSVLRI